MQIGVCQGCVLSPYLFTKFINELADKIESVCYPSIQLHPELTQMFFLLFACDVILFSNTIHGLQKGVNVLEEHCLEYNLSVNLDK